MPSEFKQRKAAETARKNFTKHGLSGHPFYRRWLDARRRCAERADYRERGIKMQDSWLDDPGGFIEHLESLPPPRPGDSLDRIDNDRGYEEGNLRWASASEQRQNQVRIDGLQRSGEDGCLCPWEAQQGCPCPPDQRWGERAT